VAQQPKSRLGCLIVEVPRSHTHNRKDSSERAISSLQRPLRKYHRTHKRDKHSCPLAANKAYSSLQSIFRSKQIYRNNKIRLYKTLINPVLSYGSVTWTLTQTTE
jgi:hypothetical protein